MPDHPTTLAGVVSGDHDSGGGWHVDVLPPSTNVKAIMYMTDVTKLSDGPVGALPCLRHAAPRSNLHACTVATLRLTYSDAAHTTNM